MLRDVRHARDDPARWADHFLPCPYEVLRALRTSSDRCPELVFRCPCPCSAVCRPYCLNPLHSRLPPAMRGPGALRWFSDRVSTASFSVSEPKVQRSDKMQRLHRVPAQRLHGWIKWPRTSVLPVSVAVRFKPDYGAGSVLGCGLTGQGTGVRLPLPSILPKADVRRSSFASFWVDLWRRVCPEDGRQVARIITSGMRNGTQRLPLAVMSTSQARRHRVLRSLTFGRLAYRRVQ